jgi:hybrid cluster-associated redox disulfide protein
MAKITGKESITEVVQKYPQTVEAFFKHGMHCLGCVAAQFETLEQGCEAHGIDAKKLIDDINKMIGREAKPKKAAKTKAKSAKKSSKKKK